MSLYPVLDGDRSSWLAADFDGPTATLDGIAYLTAGRAVGASAALKVSGSGADRLAEPPRIPVRMQAWPL